ncbi:MAG: hypothetical protein IMY86_12995 [Chloroflexi bacterium]|nr:hypothetical protein [Chloroflexota bacterium]
MLAIAAVWPETASTQGSCSDSTCDPDETAQTCPQDCGIVLVDEDFEDEQAQGWNYDPVQWEIITDTGSLVWNNTQQAWASTGSNAWSDYVLFVRVRRVNDNANLYFRTDWPNNYGLRVEGTRVVLWTEHTGTPQDLASGSVDLGTTWHDYRVDAIGPRITVTVDSSIVLTYTDGISASLRGGIGLEAFGSDGAHFDDIRLYSTVPQCYDGVRNGDETGVDCGGSCPIGDCCANRAWDADLGEGGVDCGGSCFLACQPADRLDRWTQTNGPWLEYIRRIRFDPDDPNTLIVSSNTGSGVAKSTDDGQTWHEISDGISPMNAFGLAMDPVDKNTLYVGTANGRLYATTDGGASWGLLWQYTDVDDALWTVEVDPLDRDRLFAGTGDYTGCDGRIYRSEDRGQTWDKVLDVDPASNWDGGFISHIAFDPVISSTMYATTGIGDWCGGTNPGDPDAFSFGIWKSVDGGTTWFTITNGLEDMTVSHIVIDPTDPQTLYAGVGCVDDNIALPGNVFKSTDAGASWQRLDVSPDAPITRVALHPDDPQKVYAMGYGGVFYSEDGGAHWSRLDEKFKAAVYTFFYEHAFAPDDPDTMYVGTYAGGIIKSLDGGRNWFEINGLRHHGDVLANSYGIALDPADPDTLYATTIGGLFKTADGGETWDFIGEGIFQHLRQIAVDPTAPDRLYLGGDSSFFYTSDDGGEAWNHVPLDQVALGDDPQFPVIAVDPHSPDRILAGLTGSSDILMRSTDYGQTWTGSAPLGIAGETHTIAFHPTLSGTVYAGVGWSPDHPHLIRSGDGGLTWQDAAPGLNLLTVYRMTEAGDRLYAATNGSGVHMGWGGGTGIWEPINHIGPGHGLGYVTHLVGDGGDPGNLLAFDKSDLTLYHHDAPSVPEEPWQPVLQFTEPDDDIYDVIYDPHEPDRAYATTRLGGLWRSGDGGETWAQANAGLPVSTTLRGLAADETVPGTLYVGQTGAPGRVYRSVNAGSSWSLLSSELTFSTIHAFARDSSNPDVAYAGVWGGGTWKTEDGGATWTLLPEAPASAASLAVDPRDPQIVYATDRTEPTLWQSADGGQRWWRRFNAGSDYSRLQALAIDPHQPNTVYVSAFRRGGYGIEGALFRVTWMGYTDVTDGLPRVAISLATSPDESGVILASTHVYGLYRSDDYGQSWQLIGDEDGLPKVGFNAMAWDPASGALYGGACSGSFASYMLPPGLPNGDDEPGIYRSTDGGLSWSKVLSDVVGKGFDFTSGAIYAVTGTGVYLSTDGGDTWAVQPGGPGLDYSAVAVSDGLLYVGTLGGGVYTATINPDHSLSWQGSNGPTAEIHAVQLVSIPGQPNTLFATSFPGGVFKSTDGGASWHETNFGLPGFTLPDPERNGYYALAVNPANPDNLYLGVYGYGVYRSDDGASTWLAANVGLGNRYVYTLLVEDDGSHVWAGTNDGMQSLWRSPTDTPGRLNWSPAPASPSSWQAITGIAINPENPDEMTIAAFPAGVFATPDGGVHWYERSNNLYVGKRRTHGTGFEDGYYQLTLDPINPRHLFYGTYTAQVYETRDGGQSWSAFDEGLMREGSIYAFEVAPDGTRLYTSQKAGGVLRRALDPATPQTRVISADGTPCTDGSHVYDTVAGALAAFNPGDTLIVCPGNYVESVTIHQTVRLESFAGPSRTYLYSVTVAGDNVRVAGFRLRALDVEGATGVELLGNVVVRSEIYLPIVLRLE